MIVIRESMFALVMFPSLIRRLVQSEEHSTQLLSSQGAERVFKCRNSPTLNDELAMTASLPTVQFGGSLECLLGTQVLVLLLSNQANNTSQLESSVVWV